MSITIKFGGYQGDNSVHTKAVKFFCTSLARIAGDEVDVEFQQNITLNGSKAADLLSKTESGELDACYFSSSYLAARVPELGLFDQHFVVPDREYAYAVLDGALGKRLASEVEKQTGMCILGYWDNGLRHISNARRPIKQPGDCVGLKLRTLKNEDHQRVFRALGFEPVAIDVRDLPAAVQNDEVDAQENPLTNIYNFGLHKKHRFISLTRHLLGVAPVYFNHAAVTAWPESVQSAVRSAVAEATVEQRRLAVEEDTACRVAMEEEGCEFVDFESDDHKKFVSATDKEVMQTRSKFDSELIDLFMQDMESVQS